MSAEISPMRVYLSHSIANLQAVQPAMMNDIARAQLELQTNPEKAKELGSLATHFRLTESPEEADIHLLPLTWNWYVKYSRLDLVAEAVELAKSYGKYIVLFSMGDYTARVPFSGLTIFQPCAYRSRRFENGNRVFALPAFIPDYVELYCNGQIPLREKRSRPVVGFCGLAGGKWYQLMYRLAKLQLHRAAFRLGFNPWEPPPFEPTIFRRRVLALLEACPEIECNFILRDRYRAGYRAKKKDPFHPTRMEFIQNMLDSDYIVCMRGGGNFSVRFYETLSIGRIPIFVDTDCLLPYSDFINFSEYFPYTSLTGDIHDKILAFHSSMKEDDFLLLQLRCLELWRCYLSREGFFRNFARHFQPDAMLISCLKMSA